MSNIKDVEEWYDLLEKKLPSDWKKILIGSRKRIKMLKSVLENIFCDIEKLCPDPLDIFDFTRYIKIDNIRGVILGQDPYPNEHAHGLAFSSLSNKEPQSWKPIKKVLINQKVINEDDGADLRAWEYQGVLLINTALTTKSGISKHHAKYWESYFDNILEKIVIALEERVPSRTVCWMLWGDPAISKTDIIKNNCQGSQKIMTWGHPSPLNRYNQDENEPKNFKFCDHFKKVINITKIEWDMEIRWNAIYENIELFTDGSTSPNVKSPEADSGYAVFFTKGALAGLTISCHVDNTKIWTSNNRAEAQAIIDALEKIQSLPDFWKVAKIHSDSQHCISLLTDYIPNWIKNGTSFDDKANPDLNKKMWELYNDFKKEGKKIELIHVSAHLKEPEKDIPDYEEKYYYWKYNKYVNDVSIHARKFFPVASRIESFSFGMDYMSE